MKAFVLILACVALNTAAAQTIVQVCKDAKGAIYYENARTLKKNCEKVEDASVSIIPSSERRQTLPISIGMSQDQVRNNWGKPAKVTRFETREGLTEQWEYGKSTLTFADGVLEVIQY
jgi:hypothetical protein